MDPGRKLLPMTSFDDKMDLKPIIIIVMEIDDSTKSSVHTIVIFTFSILISDLIPYDSSDRPQCTTYNVFNVKLTHFLKFHIKF